MDVDRETIHASSQRMFLQMKKNLVDQKIDILELAAVVVSRCHTQKTCIGHLGYISVVHAEKG